SCAYAAPLTPTTSATIAGIVLRHMFSLLHRKSRENVQAARNPAKAATLPPRFPDCTVAAVHRWFSVPAVTSDAYRKLACGAPYESQLRLGRPLISKHQGCPQVSRQVV